MTRTVLPVCNCLDGDGDMHVHLPDTDAPLPRVGCPICGPNMIGRCGHFERPEPAVPFVAEAVEAKVVGCAYGCDENGPAPRCLSEGEWHTPKAILPITEAEHRTVYARCSECSLTAGAAFVEMVCHSSKRCRGVYRKETAP